MWARFRTWFDTLPVTDAVQRRLSFSLQIIQFGLIIAVLPAAGIIIANNAFSLVQGTRLLALIVVLLTNVLGVWLLRRGAFQASVLWSIGGVQAALIFFLVLSGVLRNGSGLLAMMVPVVLIGLLLGRRALLIVALIAVTSIIVIAFLELLPGTPIGSSARQTSSPFSIGISVVIVFGLIVLAIDRFNTALRLTLTESTNRQRDLEVLQASLEQTVVERTASLATALRDVEQREAFLAETLKDLQASQTLVRELSAPVIPVLSGVLVVPLVGAIDETRATGVSQHILEQVDHQRAHTVIIDVTGVPLIDTHVAQTLLRAAAAIRLLGAQALLVGVRPEVAQTIVSLGANLSAIPTYASLQEAVEALMARTGNQAGGAASTASAASITRNNLALFSQASS